MPYGLVRLTCPSGRASGNTESSGPAGPGSRDIDRPGRSASATCKGHAEAKYTTAVRVCPSRECGVKGAGTPELMCYQAKYRDNKGTRCTPRTCHAPQRRKYLMA